MSNSSHMPNRATRFRAISVARSMSLAAPEVMVLQTISSAARPAKQGADLRQYAPPWT